MTRGDVYRASLEAPQGSEQAGMRPVIIVSRDAINRSSPVVIVVPLTSRSNKARLYPSHVVIRAGEGGLTADSVALCEQVRAISVSRLTANLGQLSHQTILQLNTALKIALDLP